MNKLPNIFLIIVFLVVHLGFRQIDFQSKNSVWMIKEKTTVDRLEPTIKQFTIKTIYYDNLKNYILLNKTTDNWYKIKTKLARNKSFQHSSTDLHNIF